MIKQEHTERAERRINSLLPLLSPVQLCLWLLCGCTHYEHSVPDPSEKGNTIQYNILLIEGCQYLQFEGRERSTYTHKGDCTNQCHHWILVPKHTHFEEEQP